MEVLEGFEGYLRDHVGGYDELPDGVKLALLDMVYNLGPGKLFQEYPKLLAAVAEGDWAKAAGACLRRGPGAARNVWTKEQFLGVAKQIAVQAEAAAGEIAWGDLGAGGCGSGVAGDSGGVDRIANPALRSYEARQAEVCCCCDESFVQTEESRMVIVRVPCAGA